VAHDRCGASDPIGLSASRNLALVSPFFKAAQQVVFLDADDVLPENYIEQLYSMAKDGVVTCPAEMWGDNDGIITPTVPVSVASLMTGNTIHCSAMIATELLRAYGGYDETLQAWEDWEMWMKLASKGVEFQLNSDTKLRYRRHSGSMNAIHGGSVEEMRTRLKQRYA
jgi:hypothetical protein